MDIIPETFDWKFYTQTNTDLLDAGINTEKLAKWHYINHGRNEGRVFKNHVVETDDTIKNTVSLISWIYNEECYVEHFVKHHLSVGFDKIYLLLDFKDDISNYDFLKQYDNVNIIKNEYNTPNWHINNVNKSLDLIKTINTEWTMILGIDQFYFCKQYYIKKYISTLPRDTVQFMCPMLLVSNHLNTPFSFKYLKYYKSYIHNWINSCCKTKHIISSNSHTFSVGQGYKLHFINNTITSNYGKLYSSFDFEPNTSLFTENSFTIHFYCRNYYDLINKFENDTMRYDDIPNIIDERCCLNKKTNNKEIYDLVDSLLKTNNIQTFNYEIDNNVLQNYLVKRNISTQNKINEYLCYIYNYVIMYTLNNNISFIEY